MSVGDVARPTLLMCCHYFPPHVGGVETVSAALARALTSRFRVHVVTSLLPSTPRHERVDGFEVWRLPSFHVPDRIGVPFSIPYGAGIKAVREVVGQPDIVVAHGALYPTTWLGARIAGEHRPLLLVEHVGQVTYSSAMLMGLQRMAWSTAGRWMLRRSDATVVLNSRVRQFVSSQVTGQSLRVIGNGVDAERFRPLNESERRAARARLGLPVDGSLLLAVARGVAKKRLAEILHANRGDATLVVCGDDQVHSSDGVVSVGRVSHHVMPELVGCCDALVHAAVDEGFPVAVQEASACGLPSIVRWDPGYAAQINRELLLAYDDSGLDQALTMWRHDQGRARALGESVRQFAIENWSWERVAECYSVLIDEATDRRRRLT